MGRIFFLFLFILVSVAESDAQTGAGRVATFTINAKTLQNNGGENPNRKVSSTFLQVTKPAPNDFP